VGDDVGEVLGARAVAVLIGERPGLSAPDSLGIYLTYDPKRGRTDAERNCISNVRPQGLSFDRAARTLDHLLGKALALGFSGVALKDDFDPALAEAAPEAPLP
jgi:ethanolamine ammonia-lyase small subunit